MRARSASTGTDASACEAMPATGARSRPTWTLPCLAGRLSEDPPSLTLTPPSRLVRRSAKEVASWFDDDFLAPLVFDPRAVEALVREGRRIAPNVLEALRRAPGSLPLSTMYREREGGRRYAFYIPDYCGPRLLTGRARAAGGRVLLPAISRSLRGAFHAPAGQRYLLADLDRCFQVLLATIAQDGALLEAARGDLHQVAGDAMAPELPAEARRRLGKLFNSAVLGLISPAGWHRELRRRGISATQADAREMHRCWWERFVDARRLRDDWIGLHRRAAARRLSLAIRYPDGRRYTFDVATVRGAAHRPAWACLRRPADRLAAAIRTSFSAIWRGIEGVVLDEVLHRVHALRSRGLRLVVPMYDGLLLQAPTDEADELAGLVEAAMRDALGAVGVPGGATVHVAPTWAGPELSSTTAAGRWAM